MKLVRETVSNVVKLKDRLTYGVAKLTKEAIVDRPELHYRREDRTPQEVFEAGGFTGREFTGCPVELSMFIQLNTPKIGYSGCRTIEDGLAWNLEMAETVGRKKQNPPPQHLYVSLVDPAQCQLVWIPTLVQLSGIGFMKDSAGCRIQIRDENGKVIGFENQYVPEQELLVIGDIPVQQVLACVGKTDIQLFKQHESVANLMYEFNPGTLERVRPRDLCNYTSIMSALLRENKTETAKSVAQKMTKERILEEAKSNDFEPKHTDLLLGFLKATKATDQGKETFEPSMKCKQ